MKRKILLWTLAFVITLIFAVYQRVTGPTYPLSGEVSLNGQTIDYKLPRSHGGETDMPVEVKVGDKSIEGVIYWKRFKTSDEFTPVKMDKKDGVLVGSLPHQPPAGKLRYYIVLSENGNEINIPKDEHVVVRYKGEVPLYILIPHVIAMFGAMLLSTRTGMEFFNKSPNFKKLTYWTIGFLFVGGFILGPMVQDFAFNALWTGIPFGYDLTDNKTLIAMIGWLIALFMYKRSDKPVKWALFAAILLLLVYTIPHSVLGSELDYNKLDENSQVENKL